MLVESDNKPIYPLDSIPEVIGDGDGSIFLVSWQTAVRIVCDLHATQWLGSLDFPVYRVTRRANWLEGLEARVYTIFAKHMSTFVKLFGVTNVVHANRTRVVYL